MTITEQQRDEYEALTRRVGVVHLSDWTHVEICGRDRARFLHGFCTNDIQRLAPGAGCEAFLTNAKGHVLGYVFVFCGESALVIDTVPGQAERIVSHLDRYVIREDVQVTDRTEQWAELLVGGAQAARLLGAAASAAPPQAELAHVSADVAEWPAVMRRVGLIGAPAWTVVCDAAHGNDILDRLAALGARRCSAESFEIARVEAGSPLYGRDITEDNLPQEIGRDDRAISFRKGCYLGQETVARLDALGHVHRRLVLVRFLGQQVPVAGQELTAAGRSAGRVTSVVWSPGFASPLALAYVRTDAQRPGTRLEGAGGAAEVVAVPQRL
jgi:folate-binding protein YgfZ